MPTWLALRPKTRLIGQFLGHHALCVGTMTDDEPAIGHNANLVSARPSQGW